MIKPPFFVAYTAIFFLLSIIVFGMEVYLTFLVLDRLECIMPATLRGSEPAIKIIRPKTNIPSFALDSYRSLTEALDGNLLNQKTDADLKDTY